MNELHERLTPQTVIAEILVGERKRPRAGNPRGIPKSAIPKYICSQSTLERLEGGHSPKVNPGTVRDLMEDVYNSAPALVRRVKELAISTYEPNWWDEYKPGLANGQWLRIQREERASEISSFGCTYVPTLAQSPEYLDAIFESLNSTIQMEKVDLNAAYQVRLERLERFEDAWRPFRCVVAESALMMDLGPGVAQAQKKHLLELDERPEVSVYVAEFKAGNYGVAGTEFDLLGFDDGSEPLVCVTSGPQTRYFSPTSPHGLFYSDGFSEALNIATPIKEYVNDGPKMA